MGTQGFTQAKQKLYLPPKTMASGPHDRSFSPLLDFPLSFKFVDLVYQPSLSLPSDSYLCLRPCYCFILHNRNSNGKNVLSQAKIICIHDDKEKRLIFSNLLESGSLFFMFQKSIERIAYQKLVGC